MTAMSLTLFATADFDEDQGMVTWADLQDAYGSAERVGELLSGVSLGEPEVWDELWSRLCHQDTAYSASYAALPRLAELASGADSATAQNPLQLAAGILVAAENAGVDETVRQQHRPALAAIHEVAARSLKSAGSDAEFIWGLQALVVSKEPTRWGRNLDGLIDGELEGSCKNCSYPLVIDFEEGLIRKQLADTPAGASTNSLVTAADSGVLQQIEILAHQSAVQHSRSAVAESLLLLFGLFDCPSCGHRFEVREIFS